MTGNTGSSKTKTEGIAVAGKTPRQIFKQPMTSCKSGNFKGGLALYNTYAHIDTRGNNATWGDVGGSAMFCKLRILEQKLR